MSRVSAADLTMPAVELNDYEITVEQLTLDLSMLWKTIMHCDFMTEARSLGAQLLQLNILI